MIVASLFCMIKVYEHLFGKVEFLVQFFYSSNHLDSALVSFFSFSFFFLFC